MNGDTLTVRELRDELARLPAFDGDYTNVTELRIRPQFQRVQLIAEPRVEELADEERSLVKSAARLREDINRLKAEQQKLTRGLRAIREQVRTRKPQLP